MKKLTFLSCFALIAGLITQSNQASAQITITESDFPYAGLRVVTGEDTTSGLLSGNPSSSTQNWNFSALQKQKVATTVFMLPGSTPYSGTFPTANLADSTYGGNGYTFFDSSAASFSEVGAEEIEGAGGYNFQIEINASPKFTWANLPSTYGSVIPLSYATGSETFAVTLSTVVTGEKFDTYIQYSDTIDAWGTMQMPNGCTYDVLRQKHHETDYDSIFISIEGGAFAYYERFIENKNQYDWYANGIGYILAEMDMSPTFDTVLDVIWDTTTAPCVTAVPPVVTVNLTNVSCNGGSNGTATANVSGGVSPYTYSWAPGGATTSSISGLNAGTYTITVTGNDGGATTENVTITQPLALGASGNIVSNVACNGGNNGIASVSASGGTNPYTYLWNDANSQSTVSATGLSAGIYNVSVSDSCGATETASVTITQPLTPLGISILSQTDVSCNIPGSATASAATGGTSPYVYSWSNGEGTNITASNLSAGSYTITATDSNSCTATASVTITQAANSVSISISGQTNVSCFNGSNGSATANTASGGTPPYTYSWTSGGGTSLSVSNLSAGTYSIIVTDSTGCTATTPVIITQPAAINMIADTISDNGGCDGSAWAEVSGGTAPYTYSWTGGLTTDTITNQCSGSYCCTVTDANGCMDSVCVTIELTTGINQLSNGRNLTVYPNPNNGQFTIEMTNEKSVMKNIEVFNILGEQIYSQSEIATPIMNIDLSSQPSGIYLYRVLRQNGSLIGEGKIVINK